MLWYFNDTADYFFDPEAVSTPDLAIDIFNPRYGIDPARFTRRPGAVHPFSITEEEWYGVYFQDHLTLWDRLHILGGGRQDWIDTRDLNRVNGRVTETDETAFSPRIGVLYHLWSWLGVYGNWSGSFGANQGVTATGESLPPQTGEQYEAGLKGSWLDGRLNGTLAFYHITKEKISTPDFTTPDPTDRALIKEYYEASDQFSNAAPRESILPGDPLTVIGSLRVEF